MAEVALEHVEKVWRSGVPAIRDLNLRVADGELLVLVGPSGSGKTTTLRLIAGLETPTSGTIRLDGQVVNDLAPRERNVAMVFQGFGLYPHLNVRENLAFGLRMRQGGLFRRRGHEQALLQAVDETARLLELDDVLERFPGQLSGGQQQRVALGRALVRKPAVFLLDEPLGSLDLPLRTELRRELHLLQRRFHATMMYVTHDQMEALTLGDRLVVLDRGVVQQVDAPQKVFEQPRNRFVAGFIGWPSMNFLEGQCERVEGKGCFRTCQWSLPLPDVVCRAAGGALTLGIRPEHVRPARGAPGEWSVSMEVTLVESLGSDCLVTLQRDNCRLTSKMESQCKPAQGQTIAMTFDMSRIHWFESKSGLALGEG